MNLHRTTGKLEWESLEPADYNVFQKIAATTRSIVTPANAITILGLGLVIYGLVAILNQHYWFGLVLLAVGVASSISLTAQQPRQQVQKAPWAKSSIPQLIRSEHC